MPAIQRKSKKQEQSSDSEVPEIIEIHQPKKKGSSTQEPVKVVVNDDSTSSATTHSKKVKKSAPKSDEEVEPAPKKGKRKKDEGEVVEKSKKQPPKSLGELMTDSVETLASQSEKFKVLIELKEALHKHSTTLISLRKKELKKQKEDESEDANLQFLEKQKDSLKDEIAILKLSIRELSSVSTVIEKAIKKLDSKKKKSDEDHSKPTKERSKNLVPVSTDSMTAFIRQNLDLNTNKGTRIFEQTPERNSDGRFLVETTQLMQLIHAYIRDKSLKKKDCPIELDEQLKPLFSAYLQKQEEAGITDPKLDSTSVMSVVHHHVEKKSQK